MSIVNKIRAFFTYKGEGKEMELSSAEVRPNGVFFHPINDPKRMFFVKSESVDIFINPDTEILEEDIMEIDKETIPTSPSTDNSNIIPKPGFTQDADKPGEKYGNIRPLALSKFMPSKKRFSVLLYPDEYDMLIKHINDNGYKKAEYFMVCMTSAKKQSMDATYKKYTQEHKQRHRSDLNEAKRAQAEDYFNRKSAAQNTDNTTE
ncbi:MAG: hypothetical protein IJ447_04215 [Clostridia bacterium]|nr:hypothetical protein [Clostridia bacterium]